MEEVEPTELHRVKVYKLEGETWIDKGTGLCRGEQKDSKSYFKVRDEAEQDRLLLEAVIEGSTLYQRQQDTLIVWTDSDGQDYALSFQEAEGCLALCNFLVELQHTSQPNISLVAVVSSSDDGEITEVIAGPSPQPVEPTVNNLNEVLDLLNEGSKSSSFRTALCEQIRSQGYLSKLIGTFNQCEKDHRLDRLHQLCEIAKALFFYNDMDIIEAVLDNDTTLDGVVGMLEYDPEYGHKKTNNRVYLHERIQFKEVVPVGSESMRDLMKRTCQLQFLKDVVLARFLDDFTCNSINSLIRGNQEEILQFLSEDGTFLDEALKLFNTGDDIQKKCEVMSSLRQYVLAAKGLQSNIRSDFYKSLIDRGFLSSIQFAFKRENLKSTNVATEVIVTMIEHDIQLFRTEEAKKRHWGVILVEILTEILIGDWNIALKTQAIEAMKVVVDPDLSVDTSADISESILDTKLQKDDLFLKEFYKSCVDRLFKPLIDLEPGSKLQRSDNITMCALCDLVSFIAREHDESLSKPFLLNSRIMNGIGLLIGKGYMYQVRTSALRCLRAIVLLDDDEYTEFIVNNNCLGKFTGLLEESNNMNNLVSSTCLNFLKVLLQHQDLDNFVALKDYLIQKYGDILSKNTLGKKLVDYGKPHPISLKGTYEREDEDQTTAADDYEIDDEEEEEPFEMTSPDPPADEGDLNTSLDLDRKREFEGDEPLHRGEKKKKLVVTT